MLYYIIMLYNIIIIVLYYTILFCSVSHYNILLYFILMLYYIILIYSTFYCIIIFFIILYFNVILYLFTCIIRCRLKERRMAAFELASIAATSDDNKFLIVAEGGLDTLISLSLNSDLATQDYAAETLAELLTVPQIQVRYLCVPQHYRLTGPGKRNNSVVVCCVCIGFHSWSLRALVIMGP